jgi:serine/threonine protein kinase
MADVMMHDGRSENGRGEPGESFGAYLVYERLGVGGMAEVYRAKKRGIEGFERQVALKRLLPQLAADEEFVRSFVREARLASQLRHVNIAQTYDLGRIGGAYFIAMELVDGKDLRQVLRHTAYATGPMPVPLVLSVLVQLCEALDYAHTLRDESGQALGIIHRDVSPSNVIVGRDGTTKLIDFGIARVSAGTLHTVSGQIKGKFSYMAPEVLAGQLDARADLWSLGVVAWELLTSQPLFTGGDDIAVLERVRGQDIPAPSSINRHCPRELDAIVRTALARNPTQRWQTAAQLRGALESLAHRPGMNASHQDLVRWIDWAFSQPAGTRRWDEKLASGTSTSTPAIDEPSIVIEIGRPPGPPHVLATAPVTAMSAIKTLLADEGAALALPPRPSPAAVRPTFVEGTPRPESMQTTSPWLAPQLRPPPRGTPSPPFAEGGAPVWTPPQQATVMAGPMPTMPDTPSALRATVAAPPALASSARPTVIAAPSAARQAIAPPPPGVPIGQIAQRPYPYPAAYPAAHAGAAQAGAVAMPSPPVGNPLDSPEYRAALAAFEARAMPMHQVPPAPAARPRSSAPTPTTVQRGLGLVLVLLLCVGAAVGGYLAVHLLSAI